MHPNNSAATETGSRLNELRTISFPETVTTIAWSPDGTRLAVTNGFDNRIYAYDLTRNRQLWKVTKEGPRRNQSLAFDRDGRLVVTSPVSYAMEHPEATISLIDADSGDVSKTLAELFPSKGANRIIASSFSKDRHTLVALTETIPRQAIVYNALKWNIIARIGPLSNGATQIAIESDDNTVAIGSINGAVEIWDYAKQQRVRTFHTVNSILGAMVLNPPEHTILTGGTGAILQQRILSGSNAGSFETKLDDPSSLVRAWNPQTGAPIVTYIGPGLGVFGLAVSPDGRYVAATKGMGPSVGSCLLIWDARSGLLVQQIDYDRQDAMGVAFAPDARTIAVAVGPEVHILQLSPGKLNH
jgi:WD40 repeat protein